MRNYRFKVRLLDGTTEVHTQRARNTAEAVNAMLDSYRGKAWVDFFTVSKVPSQRVKHERDESDMENAYKIIEWSMAGTLLALTFAAGYNIVPVLATILQTQLGG